MMRKIAWVLLVLLFVDISYGRYDVRYSRAKMYFKEGFELYNQSKFQEAIVKYKEAINLFPEFTKVWYFLGKAYYKLGDVEDARSCFSEFSFLSKKDKALQYLYLGDIEDKKARPITTYRRTACFKKGFASTSTAIDSHRNIFLVDFDRKRVLKFSPTGTPLLEIKGEAWFKRPYGVWVDREGDIYVTDFGGDRVQKFDKTGKSLLSFGGKGRGKGEFLGPEGITCDKEGNIYVVDNGNSRIQKFTSEGKFLAEFSNGLIQPVGIVLSEGYIWVTDKEGLKKFDSSGNLLEKFSPKKGSSLRGLTFKEDTFYISDADGYIHEFNSSNNTWKTLKLPKGSSPMDIEVDKHGTLYVADFSRKAIDIYMSKPPIEAPSSDFDLIIDRVIVDRFPTICLATSVATKDKRPLLGLKPENFRIIEEKTEIPRIGLATPYQDREDSLFIFVIDKKKVMQRYKEEIKKLLRSFTENFKIGRDAGAVISVSDKVRIEQPVSLNKLQVQNAIFTTLNDFNFKEREKDNIVFSALKQAVTMSLNLMVKKAIIFITSDYKGEENLLLKKCMNYVRNNNIPIYVIDYKEGEKNRILQNLALETHGLYLSPYRTKHLRDLYQKIKEHMKTQNLYLIFYESKTTKWSGEWVDVKVCVGYFGLYGEDRYGYFVP